MIIPRPDPRLSPFAAGHFAAPQNLWGRKRLNFRLYWNRLRWRWVFSATAVGKRIFDLTVSAFFILLISPVMLLVVLLIKLHDRGPVIFVQTRIGRSGRRFKMFKFRSMCLNAEARLAALLSRNQHVEGVTFKIKQDPRITPVGKWLRRYSLDELPQLFNVFLGDMSLVGPRPPLPHEVARYSLADRRRLAVTPGITCLWQVGGRSNIDFSGQVQLDVEYIERQSFWLDVTILAKTLPAVVSGEGAC